MKKPINKLAVDVEEILLMLREVTGLKATDIVRGSSKALGHVTTRYAAIRMLADRGHERTAIAQAFDISKRNVHHAISKATIHSKSRDIIELAQREKNLKAKP